MSYLANFYLQSDFYLCNAIIYQTIYDKIKINFNFITTYYKNSGGIHFQGDPLIIFYIIYRNNVKNYKGIPLKMYTPQEF